MEDDKIKQLFQDFQPRLAPDLQFMDRLQKSIDAIEIVKQQTIRERRRNRIAVIAAACAGFFAGVVMTLLFPLLSQWLATLTITLPNLTLPSATLPTAALYAPTLTWLLIAAISVTISITTYELTRTTPLHRRP